MHSSAPLILSPEDKLDLLRYLDEDHCWRTLEDERRCTRCREVITGRQVLVFERRGTRGRLTLQCPTVGCSSAASDWDYLNALRATAMTYRIRFEGRKKLSAMPQLAHHGRACTVPRRGRRRSEDRAETGRSDSGALRHFFHAFRAALARSPVLRSIATGLHGIHPVP